MEQEVKNHIRIVSRDTEMNSGQIRTSTMRGIKILEKLVQEFSTVTGEGENQITNDHWKYRNDFKKLFAYQASVGQATVRIESALEIAQMADEEAKRARLTGEGAIERCLEMYDATDDAIKIAETSQDRLQQARLLYKKANLQQEFVQLHRMYSFSDEVLKSCEVGLRVMHEAQFDTKQSVDKEYLQLSADMLEKMGLIM